MAQPRLSQQITRAPAHIITPSHVTERPVMIRDTDTGEISAVNMVELSLSGMGVNRNFRPEYARGPESLSSRYPEDQYDRGRPYRSLHTQPPPSPYRTNEPVYAREDLPRTYDNSRMSSRPPRDPEQRYRAGPSSTARGPGSSERPRQGHPRPSRPSSSNVDPSMNWGESTDDATGF